MSACKKILLLGGSGYVGSLLGERLSEQGWHVINATRKPSRYQRSYPCQEVLWDGVHITPEFVQAVEGIEAVINLAGQGIADQHWTKRYKEKIMQSRVLSTQAVSQLVQQLDHKPEVVIQASAVGYYGLKSRQDPCLEGSHPGDDFLTEVCVHWEKAAEEIRKTCRLCIPRIGIVLGWTGGAFPTLWDIYCSGLGSILGSGEQWMNWIHQEDLIRFFMQALSDKQMDGPYNLTAPYPITNLQFHRELAQISRSFAFLAAPSLSLKTVMGERSALMLRSPKVLPHKLTECGFSFVYPELSSALEQLFRERHSYNSHYLVARQWLPATVEQLWDFVSRAENLERITPPFLNFRVLKASHQPLQKNSLIDYRLKLHGLPFRWQTQILDWQEQQTFVDTQLKGPYKLWYHRHVFTPFAGGTLMEDRVEYELPFFPLGQIALPLVKRDVATIFAYRRQAMGEIFAQDLNSSLYG